MRCSGQSYLPETQCGVLVTLRERSVSPLPGMYLLTDTGYVWFRPSAQSMGKKRHKRRG